MSYEFWRKALQDPSAIGSDELPVHENDPQPGFYRMRGDDDMIPVAIWQNSAGQMVAKKGGQMLKDAAEIWTYCCRYPVEEQVYRGVIAGGTWPDSPPENPVVSAGHNLPEDPCERLELELKGEIETAEALLKKPVTNDDDAAMISGFAKRVSDLSKKADELHAVEKRPHLDAGKAVDAKWQWRGKAKVLASQLKMHLDGYLKRKRDEERERQRQAQIEADRLRKQAEEAARQAQNEQANPNDPEQLAAKEKAEQLAKDAAKAERAAKEKSIAVGRVGAKVTLRKVKFAVITDYDALLSALKDREEIRELVTSLANRAARSDVALPGMKIEEEERPV